MLYIQTPYYNLTPITGERLSGRVAFASIHLAVLVERKREEMSVSSGDMAVFLREGNFLLKTVVVCSRFATKIVSKDG